MSSFVLKCRLRDIFYPADGDTRVFNSLNEIKEFLIYYHSIDLGKDEIEELSKYDTNKLLDVLNWEIFMLKKH